MVALIYTDSQKQKFLEEMVENNTRVVCRDDLDFDSKQIADIIAKNGEVYSFLNDEWELIEDISDEGQIYYEVVSTEFSDDETEYDDEETQSDRDFIDDSYISEDDTDYHPPLR